MTGRVKAVLLAAIVIVAALVLHHSERKQKQLSLAAYGKRMLGVQEKKAGWKFYMDFLRFLAVILVIVAHSMGLAGTVLASAEHNLLLDGSTSGNVEMLLLQGMQYFITCLGALALVCNLLFIMLSGALLLPFKEEKPGEFYVRRFSRVVIPLAAYYVVYLLWNKTLSFNLLSIGNGVKLILSGPNDFVPHFWLVYLLLGLYLAVPFQRWMLRELPDSILQGMAAVVLAGFVLQVVYYLIGCSFSSRSILFSWEGIFFWGYFLTLPCSRKYERWLLIGGGFSAVIISYLFCMREDAAAIAVNDSLLMLLFASAIVIWCKNRDEKMKNRASRVLSIIVQAGNKYSFSILLIHWFVLFFVVERKFNITFKIMQLYGIFGIGGIVIGVLVQLLATLLISFLFALLYDQTVVFVLQKIWDKLVILVSGCISRKMGARKE